MRYLIIVSLLLAGKFSFACDDEPKADAKDRQVQSASNEDDSTAQFDEEDSDKAAMNQLRQDFHNDPRNSKY